MPKGPNEEIVTEITNGINSISKRMSLLQKKADEIEAEINNRNLNWKKDVELFNYQLDILKDNTENLKMDFRKHKNAILEIIESFRACAKKSMFDEFKEGVEKLNFEKLVTKDQFKRLLKDTKQED